ncbi:MAG: hypothetical protein NZ935_12945 [Planctomycetes bacterium]|nr:hypothetical protein [Planctomycetota bacterium]
MDHPVEPATREGEKPRQSIPRQALAWLKGQHLRFGIWLPVGAAGVLVLTLTVLYTSLATAERGNEDGYVPGGKAGEPALAPGVEVHDPARQLRGSLKAALRRGLRPGSPVEGDN